MITHNTTKRSTGDELMFGKTWLSSLIVRKTPAFCVVFVAGSHKDFGPGDRLIG